MRRRWTDAGGEPVSRQANRAITEAPGGLY
jgi:hypothetical protein